MATTTDYDAPRRSTVEDTETESLDAITTARTEAQSPVVDLDEGDTAESVELPGADLPGEELIMPVIPKQAGEFTCASCFLVQHRGRIAAKPHASTAPDRSLPTRRPGSNLGGTRRHGPFRWGEEAGISDRSFRWLDRAAASGRTAGQLATYHSTVLHDTADQVQS